MGRLSTPEIASYKSPEAERAALAAYDRLRDQLLPAERTERTVETSAGTTFAVTVAQPTYVLLGSHSEILEAGRAAARVRRLLPRAEVEIAPDASHSVGFDRPGLMIGAIRAFTADQPPVPAPLREPEPVDRRDRP